MMAVLTRFDDFDIVLYVYVCVLKPNTADIASIQRVVIINDLEQTNRNNIRGQK